MTSESSTAEPELKVQLAPTVETRAPPPTTAAAVGTETETETRAAATVALGADFGANPLHKWFETHRGRVVHKWLHYFDIYHRHFGPMRAAATPERPVVMYEIGVWNGGSVELWLDYFGRDRCEFYGFDIDRKCAAAAEIAGGGAANVHIVIGDQGDPAFLEHVVRTLSRPDIVLDDGGHLMPQQIATMHALFPHLKPGGVFACEDTHTSYMPAYGGRVRRPSTYIEAVKRLADSLHAFHSPEIARDYYADWCDAVHVYDSVVVLDKLRAPKRAPTGHQRGTRTIDGTDYLAAVGHALHTQLSPNQVAAAARADEKREGDGVSSGSGGGGGGGDHDREQLATLHVQIVRATYGDTFVRADVRRATQRAMAAAFACGEREFDLTSDAHRPQALYCDPCANRAKLLKLEVRCVVNGEYAVTQLLTLRELCDRWTLKTASGGGGDGGTDALRVPPRHIRALIGDRTRVTVEEVPGGDNCYGIAELATPRVALAMPFTMHHSVVDSSWDVGTHPTAAKTVGVATTETAATTSSSGADETKEAPQKRQQQQRQQQPERAPPTVHIVYHICTLSDWEEIVAAQLALMVASGLYAACSELLVSVVGPHAIAWQPPEQVRAKTHVVYRASDPSRYERSAIHVLQSEPPDDARSCWLYLHTKGVRHGAVNRNVRAWREFMEYYTIEHWRECVRTLLSGYDTCSVLWRRQQAVDAPGEHYSGNIWWATGAALNRLRALHASAAYLSPEMWIGYARPRAWSLYDDRRNFYEVRCERSDYEGKFMLPPDLVALPPSLSPSSSSSSSSSSPLVSSASSVPRPLSLFPSPPISLSSRPAPVVTVDPSLTRFSAAPRLANASDVRVQTAVSAPSPQPPSVVRMPVTRPTAAAAAAAGDGPVRWVDGVVSALSRPLSASYANEYRERDDDDDDDDVCRGSGGVTVLAATYGGPTHRIDVTERVVEANRAGAEFGLALAFTRSANLHRRLLDGLPDPTPGARKYLEVTVEHEVLGDVASVRSAYGAAALVAAAAASAAATTTAASSSSSSSSSIPTGSKLLPSSPSPSPSPSSRPQSFECDTAHRGETVRLRRTVRVDELMCEWRTPKTVVPRGTVSLVVAHGLANQMYGIAAGCLIAHHTRRALVFPFRVVARVTATDIDHPYAQPRASIDRDFSHLFEVAAFTREPPCMLYALDDATESRDIAARDCEPTAAHEPPRPSCRDQTSGGGGGGGDTGGDDNGSTDDDDSDDDDRDNDAKKTGAAESRDDCETASAQTKGVALESTAATTLSSVVAAETAAKKVAPSPSDGGDLLPAQERRRRAERALLHGDAKLNSIPPSVASHDLESVYSLSAPHVLAFNPFFGVVPSGAADYNRMVDVLLSLRPAARLRRIAAGLVRAIRRHAQHHASGGKGGDAADGRFVVAHCRQEADWVPSIAARPESVAQSVRRHLADAGMADVDTVAVYIMGGTRDGGFWSLVQQNRASDDVGSPPRIVWMRKEMWLRQLPEIAALEFEEGAVVDREIALAADYFVPFDGSTLSAVVVLEREAMRRQSAPVMRPHAPCWLLNPTGGTLFSYSGAHRNSRPKSTSSSSSSSSPILVPARSEASSVSPPAPPRDAPSKSIASHHCDVGDGSDALIVTRVEFGGVAVPVADFVARVATCAGTRSLYVAPSVELLAVLGDPAPNRAKSLDVVYVWHGVVLSRRVPELCGRLREPLLIGDVDQVREALGGAPKLASKLDARVTHLFARRFGDGDGDDSGGSTQDGKSARSSVGLEVGGPSPGTFGGDVYPLCGRLDNLVFSPDTVWHSTGQLKSSTDPAPYRVGGRVVGVQHIGEAAATKLATGAYDYVLASHCLEHAANALATLREWQRVVKPGGWIVVVVPWKHSIFDHRRPYTAIEHLRDDFERRVDESDLTHLDEILALHDIARDPPARDVEHMRARSLRNLENRCLHHHVFSQRLLFEIADELRFRVVEMDVLRGFDLLCIYETPGPSLAT